MMIPLEMNLLKRSASIIQYYEKGEDFSKYGMKDLCSIFNVKPLDEIKSIDGSIMSIYDGIKTAILNSDFIIEFIALISNPITYTGEVDKCGNILNSTVRMNFTKDRNEIDKEIRYTLNKVVDAAFIRMQTKAIKEISCYFNNIKNQVEYNNSLRKLSYKFFYSEWAELKSDWREIYPKEYGKFDHVILSKVESRFKEHRYDFHKISALWNFYLLNEDMLNVSADYEDGLFYTKDPSHILADKFRSNQDFTRGMAKKFKKYVLLLDEVVNSNIKSKEDINKSLCINFFNVNTKMVEAFLLSINNEKVNPLPRKVRYNRDGKPAIRYVKRTSVNFDKAIMKNEIKYLGQTTVIKDLGLIYRFLNSKERYDYYHNLLPLTALRYIYQYIYFIIDKYIDEKGLKTSITDVNSKNALKYIYIFDELKNFEPNIECINFLTDRLKSHDKLYDEKLYQSYKYLINPVFPTFSDCCRMKD